VAELRIDVIADDVEQHALLLHELEEPEVPPDGAQDGAQRQPGAGPDVGNRARHAAQHRGERGHAGLALVAGCGVAGLVPGHFALDLVAQLHFVEQLEVVRQVLHGVDGAGHLVVRVLLHRGQVLVARRIPLVGDLRHQLGLAAVGADPLHLVAQHREAGTRDVVQPRRLEVAVLHEGGDLAVGGGAAAATVDVDAVVEGERGSCRGCHER
jgi:hypothetical protein